MKTLTRSLAAAFALSLALGCGSDDGPLEELGEKIDETVEEITHPNEGPLEKAGRKTDEAIEDAKEQLTE